MRFGAHDQPPPHRAEPGRASYRPLGSRRTSDTRNLALSGPALDEGIGVGERRLERRSSRSGSTSPGAFVRNLITTPKAKGGGGSSNSARSRRPRSKGNSRPAGIVLRSRPCSVTRRSGPRSIRRSSRATRGGALDRAGVGEHFRPRHGLRHTALTETAASRVPAMFVPGEGRTCAGLDDRALPARAPHELPGCLRGRRGSLFVER